MGDGPWGYGAPEPTVKQAVHLSRTRAEVKRNLSILDALLRKRINDLGYDPYWQRFMCMNWDDIRGCSAGCANCDSCTEFHRIPPAILRPLWVYLLRAQGKPILLGLPHGQEEAGSAPVVPHERIFPKGDVRCSFWKEKSRLPCPMPSAMPAGPHIPLESDMRLPERWPLEALFRHMDPKTHRITSNSPAEG